jgi:hypothetical protein
MAKIGKHPCPIMRSVRGFHADQTSQQISKEAGYRIATQRLSHDDFSEAVDAMNLEYILRKIQTYPNDLHDILLRCSWRSRFSRLGARSIRRCAKELAMSEHRNLKLP